MVLWYRSVHGDCMTLLRLLDVLRDPLQLTGKYWNSMSHGFGCMLCILGRIFFVFFLIKHKLLPNPTHSTVTPSSQEFVQHRGNKTRGGLTLMLGNNDKIMKQTSQTSCQFASPLIIPILSFLSPRCNRHSWPVCYIVSSRTIYLFPFIIYFMTSHPFKTNVQIDFFVISSCESSLLLIYNVVIGFVVLSNMTLVILSFVHDRQNISFQVNIYVCVK